MRSAPWLGGHSADESVHWRSCLWRRSRFGVRGELEVLVCGAGHPTVVSEEENSEDDPSAFGSMSMSSSARMSACKCGRLVGLSVVVAYDILLCSMLYNL